MDLNVIYNRAAWRLWPILLLRRGDEEGFIVDEQPMAGSEDPAHPCLRTVILAGHRWFFVNATLSQRDSAERRRYDSVEGMLADGWRKR